MKTISAACLALGLLTAQIPAAEPPPLPAGYALLYEQDFEKGAKLSEFVMTDAAAWKITEEDKNGALELAAQSKYAPAVRSPVNIALIADRAFGDFVLEADLLQTGKEYGHRDMCIYFGMQDPAKFYYAHIATKTDNHAHNVFIVNDKDRTKISTQTTDGVNWGLNVWHKVRIERKASDGMIKVFYDDMTKPIMTAEDKIFGAGFVGFGSFDDTGKVDNIKIWGPSAEARRIGFYARAAE